jgi:cytochrome c biogenesis protein CcmG/thiol:disulfide interchange protein DsbE
MGTLIGGVEVCHPRIVRCRVIAALAASFALAGCGSDDPPPGPPLSEQLAALEGAPRELAALHRQANQLVGGGPDAFRAQLAELRGRPVVVNKWASWCAPCREEFPLFARVGMKLGKRVAFIGVDANDNDDAARRFLERYPVSYPTFKDPSLKVSAVFKATVAWPTTAFYDRRGELAFVRQGPYREDADLIADIRRYAG